MPADQRPLRPMIAQIAAVIDAVEPHLTPDRRPRLSAMREDLDSNLRVALVGRVNAGKSTLLNALVGQRVAPTNETECTQVVTWYRFGAPARIEVIGMDKSVSTIPLHHVLPDELGRPPDQIDHVVAYLPSGVLRDFELVDTPGLAGTNSISSAATRRALAGSTGAAAVKVFLTDGAPRQDELQFLKDIGASHVDTLALLSHADSFAEGALFGAEDPIELASRHAARLHQQLAHVAGAVVAVSGLLAETALTGNLTEDDARALHRLAAADEEELASLLISGDAHGDGVDVDRLLARVGEYGIVNGRGVAHLGAVQLGQWLAGKSGLTAVRAEILNRFFHRSDVLKARHVFNELHVLAAGSPHRSRIRSILEAAQYDPVLHRLREIQALELMLQWDPAHPLVNQLDQLTVAPGKAERLGLGPDASDATIREAAKEACVRSHQERLVAVSAAECEAWTILERSYQLMFTH